MNPSDEHLNSLLNTWTAPPCPPSLEQRLRRAYVSRRRQQPAVWTRWLARFTPRAGKFAGVLAGAVILLAVITRAFPQSLNLAVPSGFGKISGIVSAPRFMQMALRYDF